MAVTRNLLLYFLLVTATLMGVCVGTVQRVGDSSGWTLMGVDYAGWASSKSFHVGDSLVFEYDMDFHDVTEVTHQDFEACNPTSPIERFETGSDSVDLTRPGHRYFICGVPGHCSIGQKLHVLVEPASLQPIMAAPPTQPPVLPPSGSSSSSFAPSPLDNSPPANAPDDMVSPVQNGASGPRISVGLWGLLVFFLVLGLFF